MWALDLTGGSKDDRRGSDLTDLTLLLVGLILIVGALTNAPVKIAGQVQIELPAPGALAAQFVFGIVGAVCVLLGLAGRLGAVLSPGWRWLQASWHGWRAARPPARDVGIPPDRNPHFNDRDADLEQLRQRLANGGRADLTGLGGVGKSQLAIEYLHRNWSDYRDGIFWLRGETAATLSGDFAALAWLPRLQKDMNLARLSHFDRRRGAG